MTILYFGFYSLNNSRNAILMNGLKENGVMILECRTGAKSNLLKYLDLLFKYPKFIGKFDIMIVGFSGQEIMPLARLLTRKPIIFDVFTSHYMGYILDRKYFSPNSWRAKYYRWIDCWSCSLADMVILDTQEHINFFVKEFGLPREKFRRVWLGANTALFRPQALTDVSPECSIVFWGNFIPLQGVAYIIKAAKILENEAITFYLAGCGGQTHAKNKKMATDLNLKNVVFTGRLSQEELNATIARAGACLGAFGQSPKVETTIQNKIFEALASRRAVITADSPATRELLIDGKNVLLCKPANPEDLAKKIMMLKNNHVVRDHIAENGFQLFQERLTEEKIGANLMRVANELSQKNN